MKLACSLALVIVGCGLGSSISSELALAQSADQKALEESNRQLRAATDAAAKAGAEALQKATENQTIDPESLTQKASFVIGYNVMKDFKTEGIQIDIEQLIRGLRLAAEGKQPDMTDEEIVSVMQAFQRKVVKEQQDRLVKIADENKRQGVAFLKANALKEGVKELESGVQYLELETGSSKESESPRITDSVRVHYKGMLPDGTVFDTSAGGPPASFKVGIVVKGFAEALMNMKVGDKWKVFIPGEQGYGVNGNPPAGIGPNQALVFELELVEIIK